jgi:hypothetical protein
MSEMQEKHDVGLVEWGTRADIVALGERFKSMLPGGQNLSPVEAMALGQYAIAMGANPFRGEVYAYRDDYGFHLVEGYKLLVRWARAKCNYTEQYVPFDAGNGNIGYRCYILREDARDTLAMFIKAGAPWQDAYEIATSSAVGVVAAQEQRKQPPKGWTWDEVARKRALKNALNRSHGAPSMQEIATGTWEVNGVKTQPADWLDLPSAMPVYEREAEAEYRARERDRHEKATDISAPEAINDLFGDTSDVIDVVPEPSTDVEPELAEMPPEETKAKVGRDVSEIIGKRKGKAIALSSEAMHALLDAGLAENPPNAAAMVNLSDVLDNQSSVTKIVAWATVYREQRNNGADKVAAAKAADEAMGVPQ